MSKFILNIILGSFLIFTIDFGIGKLLDYLYFKQTTGSLYKTTYSLEQCKEDALVFGSSRATHHYRPDIFEKELNMSFYNTGKNGSYIFYQTALLKSILKRTAPKLIIYDFYGSLCYEESDYDRLSLLLPYYNRHPEIRDIVNLRSEFESIKNLSRIYAYNSSPAKIALGLLSKNTEKESNGYVPLHKEFGNLAKIEFRDSCELDINKIKAFKEFIDLCKSKEIPLVVVFSPVFFENSEDFMLQKAKEICDEAKIEFYDFSKETYFAKKRDYFSDEIHLNDEGAKIFSSQLAKLIKGNELNSSRNN